MDGPGVSPRGPPPGQHLINFLHLVGEPRVHPGGGETLASGGFSFASEATNHTGTDRRFPGELQNQESRGLHAGSEWRTASSMVCFILHILT